MLSETEKQALRQKIRANQHEVYVVSVEEMEAIIRSSPQGKKQSVQAAWQKIKSKIGVGASYYASADDAVTMAKLIGDLGGAGTRAHIKIYGGKPHIVLKGHPGLRNILTGTKYGIKNPKVISMGLGKTGAVHAAKSGGILSVVLLSAYRIADYVLTDEATLSQLIGSLATDVVKVGIATGASIAVATVVASAFTVAVGPILAVIVVGVATSMLLNKIDDTFGITEAVIKGLDEVGDDISKYIQDTKYSIRKGVNDAVSSVVDYTVETAKVIIINTAKHTVKKYLYRLTGS